MPKPLLCRLNLHLSTFSDGCICYSAIKCNRCLRWLNPEEGADVDWCRSLVAAGEHPADRPCWASPYTQARGEAETAPFPHGSVSDGFGSEWGKCLRADACGLQVVRPGKVQCWCDDPSAETPETGCIHCDVPRGDGCRYHYELERGIVHCGLAPATHEHDDEGDPICSRCAAPMYQGSLTCGGHDT